MHRQTRPEVSSEAIAAERTVEKRRVSIIVPMRNAADYVQKTLPSFAAAASAHGDAEIIVVNNGSTDGSGELVRSQFSEWSAEFPARLLDRPDGSIAGARNFGARHATGEVLVFLDADCLIPKGDLQRAEQALRESGAAATGSVVVAPDPGHWIESAWEDMHARHRQGHAHYINSGNFVVRRDAFEAVGGFDTLLVTGEDAEIGKKLLEAGYTIWEDPSVRAVHLGNPKTLRGFYRRTVWHGLGMFGVEGRYQGDKPTTLALVHLGLTLATLLLAAVFDWSWTARLLVIAASQVVAPAAAVLFRAVQVRRPPPLLRGILLYWLYLWGRVYAMYLIARRRDRSYEK
jgi:glycosyltransferase involved in cell wall biosynthesis